MHGANMKISQALDPTQLPKYHRTFHTLYKVRPFLWRSVTGLEVSRGLKLPDFETSAHEGRKIVSPALHPALPPPIPP
jgi:hypothetical protein